MGCTDKNQSAIQEARDQLFLDTADDNRLNIVTANLGLDRPLTGFTDDEWRALAKKIALKPKQIRGAFARVLEITVGPQFARRSDLSVAVVGTAGTKIITVEDASDFIQVGTLVFDKGLATEESVDFCFVDYETNQIFLTDELQQDHAIVASGTTRLLNNAASGATALVVTDSSLLPTTGYPYAVLLGRGTRKEEVVAVSNNDTGTNTLTLVDPLENDHVGTQIGFIRRRLEITAPIGRDFLQFDIDDTRDLPASGFIIIDKGFATEEILEYKNNDIDLHVLYLKRPTTKVHVAGASVTLLTAGEYVDTASVLHDGAQWDIYHASPRELKIYLPLDFAERLRLLDASYFHDASVTPASTTVLSDAVAGTEYVDVSDVTGFPIAGIMTLGGVETIGYVIETDVVGLVAPQGRMWLGRELNNDHLAGVAVDGVETPYPSLSLEEGNLRDNLGVVQLNQYTGPYVYAPTERSVSQTYASLVTSIPPHARIIVSQSAGFTNLEVDDASLWPSPPFAPFNVLIGRGTGSEETVALVDRTLQADAATTVSGVHPVFSTALNVPVSGAAPFPDTAVPDKAGYRIVIDPGGLDEIVTVLDHNGNNQFTITPLSQALSGGESIELLNDILTVDPVGFAHAGDSLSPTTLGHSIEPLFEEVELSSVVGFPTTGGTVLFNFGKERVSVRARLTSDSYAVVVPGPAAGTGLVFADSSMFPTTDFPYQIVVGDGQKNEELANVVVNTGTELHVEPPLIGSFYTGQYVRFVAGNSDTVEYQDIDANKLVFNPEIAFDSRHTVGERVILSPQTSTPVQTGYDFPFLLPPDAAFTARAFFDLVRAAGVVVTIVSSR